MRPDYLLLLHIVSSTLLFGTGLGTAFHGWMAHRSRDVRAIAVVGRNVVLADWLFTTPAVIVQPLTGLWMAREEGISLGTHWLLSAMVLYLIVGACWLPVVWLQLRMQGLAMTSAESGTGLPPQYVQYSRWWFALGWPAFLAVMAIFYLMVIKPDF